MFPLKCKLLTQSSSSKGFGDKGFFLAITISRSVPRLASCENKNLLRMFYYNSSYKRHSISRINLARIYILQHFEFNWQYSVCMYLEHWSPCLMLISLSGRRPLCQSSRTSSSSSITGVMRHASSRRLVCCPYHRQVLFPRNPPL